MGVIDDCFADLFGGGASSQPSSGGLFSFSGGSSEQRSSSILPDWLSPMRQASEVSPSLTDGIFGSSHDEDCLPFGTHQTDFAGQPVTGKNATTKVIASYLEDYSGGMVTDVYTGRYDTIENLVEYYRQNGWPLSRLYKQFGRKIV